MKQKKYILTKFSISSFFPLGPFQKHFIDIILIRAAPQRTEPHSIFIVSICLEKLSITSRTSFLNSKQKLPASEFYTLWDNSQNRSSYDQDFGTIHFSGESSCNSWNSYLPCSMKARHDRHFRYLFAMPFSSAVL